MSDPTQPGPPDPARPAAPVPGPYGVQPPVGSVYPAPYGQAGYPAQSAPTQSNDAVVALVLSIASWVICPVVLAVIALVFAGKAKRAIEASGGWITGEGMVTAAKVISWINIALCLVVLVGFVIFLLVLVATSSTTSG